MKNLFIKIRDKVIGFVYRKILKKILFKTDPEMIHDHAIRIGQFYGSNIFLRKFTSIFFSYSNNMLSQNILDMEFKNPVGLAAGFDKNAKIIKVMPELGFGFTEVGSITFNPCSGNPKPRLWRLLKSKGILVNYGLNNEGAKVLSEKLSKEKDKWEIPVGINIAKTNCLETDKIEEGINDYVNGIKYFLNIGDYLTINISCPSISGGRPFSEADNLKLLLEEVNKLNIKKPVFFKMPPDLSHQETDRIIQLADQYNISGFICSNLTKDRNNPDVIPEEINRVNVKTGGVSGKPAEKMSNDLISYIYKNSDNKIIMGCGGIFNAEDAYRKIKLGASLLQLITGMIFEGPQVISEINYGLCQLLKKDGFKNIKEAIGIDSKKT